MNTPEEINNPHLAFFCVCIETDIVRLENANLFISQTKLTDFIIKSNLRDVTVRTYSYTKGFDAE